MTNKESKLLEAHVQFTLKGYQSKQLDKKIADTIDAVFEQLADVTANELVDNNKITETVRTMLLEAPVKAEFLVMILTMLLGMIELDLLHETAIKDLLSKKSYNLFVKKFVESDAMRTNAIGRMMESDVYAELISDVLYNGIKDYIAGDSSLVNKLPGVSALFKAGKRSIGKSIPSLDASIEATTKSYIHANIKRSVSLSKSFLENDLDEQRIKSIANGIWKQLGTQKLSTFTKTLDEETLEEFIGIGNKVWEDVRKSDFLVKICSQMAGLWLETYGDQPIAQLLDSIGIGKQGIISQLQAYAPDIVQKAEESGYLEAQIRAQLAPFYKSKELKQILKA
jgi:hypothetical protein